MGLKVEDAFRINENWLQTKAKEERHTGFGSRWQEYYTLYAYNKKREIRTLSKKQKAQLQRIEETSCGAS